jgi:glutathione peroxidase
MKSTNILFLILTAFIFTACFNKSTSRPMENTTSTKGSIYDIELKSIDGTSTTLEKYKGKKLLIVNVASKCGFTPQYDDLQKLYEEYGQDVVILGFPADNFGGQEPGSNEEIESFCKTSFGVSFPMFEKSSVKGDNMNPLYKWLTTKSLNGWNEKSPTWNFCKYVVNEEGELTNFFESGIKPFDDELLAVIK